MIMIGFKVRSVNYRRHELGPERLTSDLFQGHVSEVPRNSRAGKRPLPQDFQAPAPSPGRSQVRSSGGAGRREGTAPGKILAFQWGISREACFPLSHRRADRPAGRPPFASHRLPGEPKAVPGPRSSAGRRDLPDLRREGLAGRVRGLDDDVAPPRHSAGSLDDLIVAQAPLPRHRRWTRLIIRIDNSRRFMDDGRKVIMFTRGSIS